MTRTHKRLLRLAVAGLFAGTATTIAIGPAAAADCQTSAQYGECTSGSYTFYNDEWGSGYGSQTLWEDGPTYWGVDSTQPNTSGVKSYPNESLSIGESLNSLPSLTSSFGYNVPSTGNWEAAYDIWLNSSGIEVMVWTDTNGNETPLGSSIGDLTIDGNTWDVYVGSNGSNPTYSFKRTSNETSGSVNLLDLLKWLENTKGYYSNPTLSTIDFGWEIASTGGVQEDYTVWSYSLSD